MKNKKEHKIKIKKIKKTVWKSSNKKKKSKNLKKKKEKKENIFLEIKEEIIQ